MCTDQNNELPNQMATKMDMLYILALKIGIGTG